MLDVTELKHTQMARLREADRRIAERTRFEATLRRQADDSGDQLLRQAAARFAPPPARMTCCDVCRMVLKTTISSGFLPMRHGPNRA